MHKSLLYAAATRAWGSLVSMKNNRKSGEEKSINFAEHGYGDALLKGGYCDCICDELLL